MKEKEREKIFNRLQKTDLPQDIIEEIMDHVEVIQQDANLAQVREFHTVFKHPIEPYPTFSTSVMNLRISLLLEELAELSEACGMDPLLHFLTEIEKVWNTYGDKYRLMKEVAMINGETTQANPVEVLDALCDLQYVLSGAVLTFGYGADFEKAFALVHQSNMSKAATSKEEAEETVKAYSQQGVRAVVVPVTLYSNGATESTQYFVIKRESDGKILKAKGFQPVDLTELA